jgi:hypothetical protein
MEHPVLRLLIRYKKQKQKIALTRRTNGQAWEASKKQQYCFRKSGNIGYGNTSAI